MWPIPCNRWQRSKPQVEWHQREFRLFCPPTGYHSSSFYYFPFNWYECIFKKSIILINRLSLVSGMFCLIMGFIAASAGCVPPSNPRCSQLPWPWVSHNEIPTSRGADHLCPSNICLLFAAASHQGEQVSPSCHLNPDPPPPPPWEPLALTTTYTGYTGCLDPDSSLDSIWYLLHGNWLRTCDSVTILALHLCK